MISFNEIPITLRVPGVYVEFDNSQAVRGLVVKPYRVVALGQMLSSGTATPGVLVKVSRAEQAPGLFGRGSHLDRIVRAFKANNGWTDFYVLPMLDDAAGTKGTANLAFTGPATAAGTLRLYIGGQLVSVGVTASQTANSIAAAVMAAVNAALDVPCVATNPSGANVVLTARHKGLSAGTIDVRFNYYAGDAFPAGVACTITAFLGQAGDPSIASAITAIGDEWFDFFVMPYSGAANLALLKTETAARWGPLRSIEAHAITSIADTWSGLTATGATLNDPHLTVVGVESSPTPSYEWAAAVTGVAAYFGNIDPARPLQTLSVAGVLAPAIADRFVQSERNLALYDGISTYTVDADGTVRLERLITTYQTSQFGADDPSYLDVETMLTLGFLRYTFRNRFRLKFPRHKLARDGTRFGPGQVVLTPNGAKAEAFAIFREWESLGLVENFDQFKADILVEINSTDPNRLDMYLPPDLVNQLRVVAAQIGFRL